MKVVLFCGGLGMRLREHSENIPKPIVHACVVTFITGILFEYSLFRFNVHKRNISNALCKCLWD
jgi:NDP-sugar pyrophosphorylase family protein